MTADLDISSAATDAPRYARFARRLRAMLIDWVIMIVLLFGGVGLAASLANDAISRVLGFAVVAMALLYEPVLVSWTGGTLGHRFTNLRVVDEAHGGNVSFLKACARVIIKGVLGLYSFVVMAATRRNQAVHDLLTHSTVQIRDAAIASDHDYIAERVELSAADMPSRSRRPAVILLYALLSGVLYLAGIVGLVAAGWVSESCFDTDICSAGENTLNLGLTAGFLAALAVLVVAGWRGRLFGARRGSIAQV